MAIRAKDIADMLGVSTATVSLVLNNKPGVGDVRRQQIINKINELDCGYLMKEQRIDNGSIGFVVYKRDGHIVDESPFFTYILEGINNCINKQGYTLNFIYINKSTPRLEQEYQLKSGNYKGLIVFAVEMFEDDLQLFLDIDIPFTLIDNSFMGYDVDSVSINNLQGTNEAVKYLCSMGHQEIGYIRSKVKINSFNERYSAFKHKIKRYNRVYKKEYIVEVGYTEEEVRKDIKSYIENSKVLPTAFFAENDLIACNAIRGIQECGLQVPEDISIIGFDNRPISSLVNPKLTTINVPKDVFGPQAVYLLMQRMEDQRKQSLKIEIGTDLIVRESVKRIGE